MMRAVIELNIAKFVRLTLCVHLRDGRTDVSDLGECTMTSIYIPFTQASGLWFSHCPSNEAHAPVADVVLGTRIYRRLAHMYS